MITSQRILDNARVVAHHIGMDVFYNIWELVNRRTQQSRFGEWFKVPKVYRSKEEEKAAIARKQLALILDNPDRKKSH